MLEVTLGLLALRRLFWINVLYSSNTIMYCFYHLYFFNNKVQIRFILDIAILCLVFVLWFGLFWINVRAYM